MALVAAYSPAIIQYHTLFYYYNYKSRKHGIYETLATLPIQHQPHLNPRKSFVKQSIEFKSTSTKRRLSTSHIPILEPVLEPALPSYIIYSNSLPPSSLTFYGIPPRDSRVSAIHLFLGSINDNYINTAVYDVLRGSSYIQLPAELLHHN